MLTEGRSPPQQTVHLLSRGLLKPSHTRTTGHTNTSANGGLPFPPSSGARHGNSEGDLPRSNSTPHATEQRALRKGAVEEDGAAGCPCGARVELLDFVLGTDVWCLRTADRIHGWTACAGRGLSIAGGGHASNVPPRKTSQ